MQKSTSSKIKEKRFSTIKVWHYHAITGLTKVMMETAKNEIKKDPEAASDLAKKQQCNGVRSSFYCTYFAVCALKS